MRPISRRALVAAGGLVAVPALSPAFAAAAAGAASLPADTPTAVLQRLLAGNRRFTAGRAEHPRQRPSDVRVLAQGQRPSAIVLGCADSRVSPEILFDQGVGDIFDNRVAGNIVDPLLLGSIEFALEEFSPPVLMILGHERCGAITATIDAIEHDTHPPGHIPTIIEALRPIVTPVLDTSSEDKVDAAVIANVRAQIQTLRTASEIVRTRVEAGTLTVVGARYDLDTATVTMIP